MLPKLKVLFLCTGNSCRSQMAEGWARHLHGDLIEPFSAGIEPHGLNPRAVRVMAEVGVDISRHRSNHVDELRSMPLDLVVTVCDSARESCPVFPGSVRMIHWSFDDPPRLATGARTEDEALTHYRRVRDEIRDFVDFLPGGWKRDHETRSTREVAGANPSQAGGHGEPPRTAERLEATALGQDRADVTPSDREPAEVTPPAGPHPRES